MPQQSSSPRRKEQRAASWRRGEARKEARRAEQKAREQANKMTLALGQLTPWGLAKLARRAQRVANTQHSHKGKEEA